MGAINLASTVPYHASQMYARKISPTSWCTW
jgi:NAD/NADP transhydrogenase alpha subunit